jgi:hypothetical protein
VGNEVTEVIVYARVVGYAQTLCNGMNAIRAQRRSVLLLSSLPPGPQSP